MNNHYRSHHNNAFRESPNPILGSTASGLKRVRECVYPVHCRPHKRQKIQSTNQIPSRNVNQQLQDIISQDHLIKCIIKSAANQNVHHASSASTQHIEPHQIPTAKRTLTGSLSSHVHVSNHVQTPLLDSTNQLEQVQIPLL
eukprot:311642_1